MEYIYESGTSVAAGDKRYGVCEMRGSGFEASQVKYMHPRYNNIERRIGILGMDPVPLDGKVSR